MRLKKSLGQHFLIDNNIKNKIITLSEITNNDNIIEIGPGEGALTKYIYPKCKNLILIEKDKRFINNLKHLFPNASVFNTDFLEWEFPQNNEFKIIGNLPYNVSNQILFKIFKNHNFIKEIVIMVQKEVSQRILAFPKTSEYSLLSVISQSYLDLVDKFDVSPKCFYPPPKVFSTVLKFKVENKYNITNFDEYFTFVKALFFGKRKKIRNIILKNPFLKFPEEFLEKLNELFLEARISDIPVDEIYKLFNLYKNFS